MVGVHLLKIFDPSEMLDLCNVFFSCRRPEPPAQTRTGTWAGTPGVPGVTALAPAGEEPPTHCGAASTESESF